MSGDDRRWPEIGFEDLIGTTRFDVHERAHIVVDGAVCADCSTRDCVVACPAKLFVPTADGGILFNYEQCFECGTCYLVCNRGGGDLVVVPRGRPRRRVPPVVIAVCWKWIAARR